MKSTEVRYKILELLPIFQQDAWKKLGLEHRQVSKVVLGLEKEGFLTRTKDKNSFYLDITIEGVREGRRLSLLSKHMPVPVSKPVIAKKPVHVKAPAKKPVVAKKPVHVKAPIIKKEPRYAPLLSSDGMFSPCTGCSGEECDPTTCAPLTKWAA